MQKNLVYNHETNLTHDSIGELHDSLFFPKMETVIDYVAAAIKNGNKDFQFFGKHNIWPAVNNVIRNCYDKQRDSRKINVDYLYDALEDVAVIVDKIKFFRGLNTHNRSWYEDRGIKLGRFIHAGGDTEIVGNGVLAQTYKDADNDCYETAGGYRNYVALEGTTFGVYLNRDLSFRCSLEMSCVEDHYNNNFYGVSTGNGTTTYDIGKRVATRSVNMNYELLTKDPNYAAFLLQRLDTYRALDLIKAWYPQLAECLLQKQ
jgi:hypothetical protein